MPRRRYKVPRRDPTANILNSLFSRDRWIDQKELGHDDDFPKMMYRVKDQRGLFDPTVS